MVPTPDKALLIGRTPLSVDSMDHALRTNGWTTRIERSGAAGIAKFRSTSPEVVITELRLPDLSGLHVARAVHLVDPDLPVLVVGDEEDVETVLNVIRGGAFDYVVRPKRDHSGLLAAADRARAHYRLVQENRRLTASLKEVQEQVARGLKRELDAVREFGDRIRAPLAALGQGLDRLFDAELPATATQMVGGLQHHVAEIVRALDSLEDTQFQPSSKLDTIDLYALIVHVRDTVLQRLHDRAVDLAYFLPETMPQVHCSLDQVGEALRRAIAFGAAGGGPGAVELRVGIVDRTESAIRVRFEVRGPDGAPISSVDKRGDFDLDMWKRTVFALGGESGASKLVNGGLAIWFVLELRLATTQEVVEARPLEGLGVVVLEPNSGMRRCVCLELAALGARGIGVSTEGALYDALRDASSPVHVVLVAVGDLTGDVTRITRTLGERDEPLPVVTLGRLDEPTPHSSIEHLVRPPSRRQLAAAILSACDRSISSSGVG